MKVRAVGDTGAEDVAPVSAKQAEAGSGRMLWWRLASVALFCGAWEVAGRIPINLAFPSFSDTMIAFFSLMADGSMVKAYANTLLPLLIGVVISAVLGIGLGVWMGLRRTVEWFGAPVFTVLQAAPMAALIPLITFTYGIGLTAKVLAVMMLALPVIVLTIAFLYVPQLTRIVRANVLDQYGEDYVSAVRVMGASTPRIIVKHVARNCLAPIMVFATVLVADAIVYLAVNGPAFPSASPFMSRQTTSPRFVNVYARPPSTVAFVTATELEHGPPLGSEVARVRHRRLQPRRGTRRAARGRLQEDPLLHA